MVSRIEGWELRFSEYLKQMKTVPFEWGVSDCVLFGSRGFEVITGLNFYDQYLGYTDEAGAAAIIEQNGGLENLVSQHIGPAHKEFLKAKRGDVVLVKAPLLCLGMVDDSGQYIAALSPKGWIKLPLNKAYRIWSY